MSLLLHDERAPLLRLNGRDVYDADLQNQEAVCPNSDGEVLAFLARWFDDSDTVPGQTSGSTGTPKRIFLSKSSMMHSARLTCAFLGLQQGDTALLCMPLRYVGAKMMVVRSIVAGMRLCTVSPSSHPLRNLTNLPDFVAMTPMQALGCMETEEERARFAQIRQIILGGSSVPRDLALRLRDFPNAIWSTYGMTETVSHIALRRLNGSEASEYYRPFEGIGLSLNERGTLVIDAPLLHEGKLETNDLAEICADGAFRILGRCDNTVNSGGVKIQIEKAEELLQSVIPMPFFLTSVPDAVLGEKLVCVLEGIENPDEEACRAILPKYWMPKMFLHADALPLTGSGKADRAELKKLAITLLC
ncbi:MAG: AMP-binding protein [Desulfovibrionaceae bacterium]|nr:AMP-binding protein [Desulfovibrionaceae bacterium]